MVEDQIPTDKLYFKIGEVARIVGVKPYVLRYWETEFSVVKPGKTESRHRLYKRRDVETLLEIKKLLHGKRFTIEGARKFLSGGGGRESSTASPVPLKELREIRNSLLDLRQSLN